MKIQRMLALAGLGGTLLLSGCAIHQNVRAVEGLSERQICVIENPAVRAGFLNAYRQALGSKGYTVRQLPAGAATTDCPVTSTYTANWRWDMALYMAYAEINVYRAGQKVGEAKYDAMSGGANLNKFIAGDKKIQELVHQLFPGGAGT
ncbi:MAG: hypothetical protein JWP65_3812 [Ramlibacter sp.]|jgi:hypothetical protein|uniref:Sbal_3080 family lipoprotein n=1 Tax=Ramlibacter sp. TaxID=1917967 RepID=UPI00263112E4|nr:Sbal_3080 family lipoprotein [Ramlibacter sp.]MDB5753391.1 hypothetical protein [Ramlibacter sp.]